MKPEDDIFCSERDSCFPCNIVASLKEYSPNVSISSAYINNINILCIGIKIIVLSTLTKYYSRARIAEITFCSL